MMGTVRFPDQIAIGTLARLVRSPWNSARATDTDWCAVMELLDKNLRQVLAMSPSRLQRLSWAHNIASGCVLGAGTVPASSLAHKHTHAFVQVGLAAHSSAASDPRRHQARKHDGTYAARCCLRKLLTAAMLQRSPQGAAKLCDFGLSRTETVPTDCAFGYVRSCLSLYDSASVLTSTLRTQHLLVHGARDPAASRLLVQSHRAV